MCFANSWVVSGRLRLQDWLFLPFQKACNHAKHNCLPTCLIASLSLAWYGTTWKLSDNGWARAFVSPLGKHLSAVMYSPKFSKQDDKESNRIKRRKLVCDCQKASWAEILASCANQSLDWQLFSVWTVQMHLVGRLGYVLWVEWLQSHFAGVLSLVGTSFPGMDGWEMAKHYWAVWKS